MYCGGSRRRSALLLRLCELSKSLIYLFLCLFVCLFVLPKRFRCKFCLSEKKDNFGLQIKFVMPGVWESHCFFVLM